MKFRFLGTGTSVGVPQIGCTCKVCTSADPRDRRRRCGAYVTSADGPSFLVDTPPEMRLACIEYGISKVDAVVLTHAHMDHVAGFDDERRFNTINGTKGPDGRVIGAPMPCFAAQETLDSLHRIFPYISVNANEQGLFRPMIDFVPVDGPFTIELKIDLLKNLKKKDLKKYKLMVISQDPKTGENKVSFSKLQPKFFNKEAGTIKVTVSGLGTYVLVKK